MNKILDALKKPFNKRSLKYGSNSILLISAVLAITVIVNLLISPAILKNIMGKDAIKLDLTKNKLYSVGDTTKKILKELNKDVQIYALFDEVNAKEDVNLTQVNETLKQYVGDKVKLEYVDTDKKPGFIKTLDPDGVKGIARNDIVFVSGKKIKNVAIDEVFETQFNQETYQTELTGYQAEQVFSGAIKYVSSDVTPVAYFLEGHDEKKLDSEYKTASAYLSRNNFEVKSINLAIETKMPADAALLVVLSPGKDLSASETDKINVFLKDGGNALFTFDPIDNDPRFPNFENVLSAYNVSLNYDIVKEMDDKRVIKNRPNDIVVYTQDNSINSPIGGSDYLLVLPKTRSLNILKNQKQYIDVTSLLKTSTKAVGEVIDTTKGKNTAGPMDLAIAVENKGGYKVSRIMVLGNSSFISDSLLELYPDDGMAFFMNSINWVQNKQNDVVIAAKKVDTPALQVDAMTANIISFGVVLVLPLMIFGIGTFVWMKRRHL